jgi:hypothetical protein
MGIRSTIQSIPHMSLQDLVSLFSEPGVVFTIQMVNHSQSWRLSKHASNNRPLF